MLYILLAKEVEQGARAISAVELVIYFLVPVGLLAFIWYIFTRYSRNLQPLQERSMEHMDRLEAKVDRMIALLEEISRKVDRWE